MILSYHYLLLAFSQQPHVSLFVKVYSLLNSPLGNTLAYLTTHAFVILLVIFSQRHFTFHIHQLIIKKFEKNNNSSFHYFYINWKSGNWNQIYWLSTLTIYARCKRSLDQIYFNQDAQTIKWLQTNVRVSKAFCQTHGAHKIWMS